MASLARIGQGVLLHQHIASAYGTGLSPERVEQAHIRPLAAMLGAILARDGAALGTVRPLDERLVCVCRHYTILTVALLRAKGFAPRSRCGFGAYFQMGRFIDHWVAEYWNADHGRWILVDSQIDEVQRALFKIVFDTLDVPRDQFLVAGDAWALCRAGKADPAAFGVLDMHGLWFIASNVLRDLAALNTVEMLPWDVWGAMVPTDKELDLPLIDRLAVITCDPDAHFDELRGVYQHDPRLRVPDTVVNAVRNRPEAVSLA